MATVSSGLGLDKPSIPKDLDIRDYILRARRILLNTQATPAGISNSVNVLLAKALMRRDERRRKKNGR